jgi:hypothetical protein
MRRGRGSVTVEHERGGFFVWDREGEREKEKGGERKKERELELDKEIDRERGEERGREIYRGQQERNNII